MRTAKIDKVCSTFYDGERKVKLWQFRKMRASDDRAKRRDLPGWKRSLSPAWREGFDTYTYVSRGILKSYKQGIKRQRLYKQAELEALLQLRPSTAPSSAADFEQPADAG